MATLIIERPSADVGKEGLEIKITKAIYDIYGIKHIIVPIKEDPRECLY